MTESPADRRVLLAVTETSSLERLWQSLTEHLADAQAEVLAVFVNDDVWRRAASLPFTREICRVSGIAATFTEHRARQVREDAAGRARQHLEQLAATTKMRLVFEILPENDEEGLRSLVSIERDVLIAPAALEGKPLFAELARWHRQVVLVEVEDDGNEPDS